MSIQPLPTLPQPCPSCPWRVSTAATDIPHFDIELAEDLAECCPDEDGHGPDLDASMFACHQSRPGGEFACAGWLAVVGHKHPLVRLAVRDKRLPATALLPGRDWPPLHATYPEVIDKLHATLPADAD
ncbi:DUF6283 family protein [Massilia jejuensis]|uniref:DUF6283 family protein n=1 Tax=Massilia jejuensis TaxID=648894 RepID=A0ABW0PEP8_9BURK